MRKTSVQLTLAMFLAWTVVLMTLAITPAQAKKRKKAPLPAQDSHRNQKLTDTNGVPDEFQKSDDAYDDEEGGNGDTASRDQYSWVEDYAGTVWGDHPRPDLFKKVITQKRTASIVWPFEAPPDYEPKDDPDGYYVPEIASVPPDHLLPVYKLPSDAWAWMKTSKAKYKTKQRRGYGWVAKKKGSLIELLVDNSVEPVQKFPGFDAICDNLLVTLAKRREIKPQPTPEPTPEATPTPKPTPTPEIRAAAVCVSDGNFVTVWSHHPNKEFHPNEVLKGMTDIWAVALLKKGEWPPHITDMAVLQDNCGNFIVRIIVKERGGGMSLLAKIILVAVAIVIGIGIGWIAFHRDRPRDMFKQQWTPPDTGGCVGTNCL